MKLTARVQRVKPSPTLAITAKANSMKVQGIDVIGFGAGEPDFDTPEHIKKAAIDAINSGFTKYTAESGIVELKDAIIGKLQRENNLTYTREEIIVCNGGKHALYNIAQALFEEGDEIIIPAPFWVSYPDQALLNDAKPVVITATDKQGFKITAEQLKAAITPKTKAFVLNSPSNPAGCAYTKDELKKLADVLVQHPNVVCISDEIYEKIVYDGFEQVSIASLGDAIKKQTIIVNGASKAYAMTGWRMGFAAGPKEVISAMSKVQGQVTSNVCSIVQKACVAAFSGTQEPIQEMLKAFQERRNVIVDRLNDIPNITCLKPQGAFYVLPNISALFGKKTAQGKTIAGSADLATYLLDEVKVAVVPGDAFGAEGFMRLSYACSMKNIETGISRIKEAVSRLS